jgi:predicted HTH domain antitoxin
MQKTAVSFSENVLLSLNLTMEEIISSMRKDYAMKMYQQGKLTLGQCAEFCALDKYDFISLLAANEIPVINYDVEDFKNELQLISLANCGGVAVPGSMVVPG